MRMLSRLTNPALDFFLDLGLGLSWQSLHGELGNWFWPCMGSWWRWREPFRSQAGSSELHVTCATPATLRTWVQEKSDGQPELGQNIWLLPCSWCLALLCWDPQGCEVMGESVSLTLILGRKRWLWTNKKQEEGRPKKKKNPVPSGPRLISSCVTFFSNLPPLGIRVMAGTDAPPSWSSFQHHDAGIVCCQQKLASFSRKIRKGIIIISWWIQRMWSPLSPLRWHRAISRSWFY